MLEKRAGCSNINLCGGGSVIIAEPRKSHQVKIERNSTREHGMMENMIPRFYS